MFFVSVRNSTTCFNLNKLHFCHTVYLWSVFDFHVHTGFWWGDLREGDHLGDPGIDGSIILEWIFKKWDVGAWTGLSWLRIGTGGGLL
jgi:hypothetical protein